MWFFRSPEIIFGEDALDYLLEIQGSKALIVTDQNIVALGFVEQVQAILAKAGIGAAVFAEVEPNPSMENVQRGAEAARTYGPDWIVALGGGSSIDAAKSIWIQYERPDLAPDEVAPMGTLGLRQKARLIAIPTTSGTGAETTWPFVLTDRAERRKISLGHPENIPDIAIVDPVFVGQLPPQITADTGMDVLTHAVEGYTSQWHNDFADGLCLKAIQLVFDYLPRSYVSGSSDLKAREKMHNAATIAGLGFGNSMAAMAHGLGHALGALFPIPHGRAVGLFLPYTVEFTVRGDLPTRYSGITRFLDLPAADEATSAASLAEATRDLARRIGQPNSLQEAGISRSDLEAELPKLINNALNDSTMILGLRFPDEAEVEKILDYAFEGKSVDF
ncbi:MAG: iron-containing alcohol dehydrogenase [Anaerolineae bacterium]|nr:MAG: iron-containing alcohol dehydrogenase [Anaerolineae bacterium]